MAVDKAVESAKLNGNLTAVANAIRAIIYYDQGLHISYASPDVMFR